MKISRALSAIALIGLAGCGGEPEVEEPVVAEERLGEREAIAPVGEGELAREEGELGQEGLMAGEGREGEAVIGEGGVEREE
ncbi:MAG TPA: hypothetical protein VGR19_09810 [Allosphingosinicella sp.]|nr:hypothetical protein [Allosphingosinicella sp.]